MTRLSLLLVSVLPMACFGSFEARGPQREVRPAGTKSKPKASPKKSPGQSYRQAWEQICHAEARSGASASTSRAERGSQVASWIVEQVKNKEARYWFISFGKVKDAREAVFVAEAAKAGVTDCPLAQLLFDGPPASLPTTKPTHP